VVLFNNLALNYALAENYLNLSETPHCALNITPIAA